MSFIDPTIPTENNFDSLFDRFVGFFFSASSGDGRALQTPAQGDSPGYVVKLCMILLFQSCDPFQYH